jgi:hypothetical protein
MRFQPTASLACASFAAAEALAVSQRPERGYSGREKGKQERTPFAELRSAIERETMVSKEPQPVHALQNANRRVCSKSTRERMATAGNGTAGRKPTSRETTWAV